MRASLIAVLVLLGLSGPVTAQPSWTYTLEQAATDDGVALKLLRLRNSGRRRYAAEVHPQRHHQEQVADRVVLVHQASRTRELARRRSGRPMDYSGRGPRKRRCPGHGRSRFARPGSGSADARCLSARLLGEASIVLGFDPPGGEAAAASHVVLSPATTRAQGKRAAGQ